MEGKVIKEEVIGSPPSLSPQPPIPNNTIPINNNTPPSSHQPTGKENRRLPTSASPPLTPSEIQTRSRSKGLTKENYSHHHHHHHHHRMSESPKMVGLGSHQPPGTSNSSSSSSTSQQSPTMVTHNNSKNPHGKTFGHSFSSPHSTTTLTNGTNSATTGVRVTSPSPSPTGSGNGGRTSSSANNSNNNSKTEHMSLGGTSRLIIKMKRFLGTLMHFGCDISSEVGERVKSLVFNLVSGHLTIEDFHHTVQEVTSFPLRPFVVPFLKAHLPLLQREVSHLARISKQSPLSFVRTHEQVIVESGSSPGEPCDIFHSEAGESLGLLPGKRKSESLYENGEGSDGIPTNYSSTPKRFNGGGGLFSPSFFLSNLSSALNPASSSSSSSADLRDFYSNAAGYHLLTSQLHSLQSDPNTHAHQSASASTPTTNGMTPGPSAGKGAPEDEWRNIHVMLNCILSMVEKTKRALTILQNRTTSHDVSSEHNLSGTPSSGSSSAPTNSWLRRPLSGFPTLDSSDEFKRQAGEMMAHALRATEDRVAEVKRRAEDAVLEVKRQALAELQRAVAAAEARACEAVQVERARLERVFLDSRRNGDSLVPVDPETCWNCGRKAHETCSGCNTARYCSSFCQHKDWEQHHSNCGRGHSERNGHQESKNTQSHVNSVHVPPPENSNSPINVSHPSPDNRSSGSRSN